jgi:OOP family OmpA-OmpF porin
MFNKLIRLVFVFACVLSLGFTNIALAECGGGTCNKSKHHNTECYHCFSICTFCDSKEERCHHKASHHKCYKDVVVSSNGNFVRDSSGGCVRTAWNVSHDKCCHPHKREIMKMEERIIYFDFDKYSLKEGEKEKLDVLASALREQNIRAVKVVGYTDRLGHEKYNDKLSRHRANEVSNYLGSRVHLDRRTVHLRALGERNQVKACSGKTGDELISCLAPNRRVEVEVDYIVHKKR